MRFAPAFELDVTPGRLERVVLATIGGTCAAVVGAWLWSHVDAAAGRAGHGALAWAAVVVSATLPGLWLGWRLAPRSPGTLAWRQGEWTLSRPPAASCAGAAQAKLDGGSWMLLCFRPADGSQSRWLAVRGSAAGPAWHALRATLFAPGAPGPARGPDEGASA
ncbi:MAG TPA: hypothetical protein VI032_08295 [Burkholderiaceae bacterium]